MIYFVIITSRLSRKLHFKRAEERGIASGIAIGTAQTEARVQEERQIIRDRLIASGMPSQEASVLTGLSV